MCPQIVVKTGVDISNHGYSLNQELSNAIKIAVVPDEGQVLNPERCHFLQFITRRAPELFSYGENQTVIWESADLHYMVDPCQPKWRVDCVGNTPFYEVGGASEFTTKECAVFDEPGYAIPSEIQYEMIIGCTFVIVEDQVIGKVLWSRQYIKDEKGYYDAYQYIIDDNVNQLPDWALLTMKNEYQTNVDNKTYEIPSFLDHETTESKESAILLASQDLTQHLPPPTSWALLHHDDFKQLMELPAKNATQQFKMELNEIKEINNSTRENNEDGDDFSQSDMKEDTKKPIVISKNNNLPISHKS